MSDVTNNTQNDEKSSKNENLEFTPEEIEKFKRNTQLVVNENSAMIIFAELLANDEITASELLTRPAIANAMKKSTLYRYLNKLEEIEFIKSEIKEFPSSTERKKIQKKIYYTDLHYLERIGEFISKNQDKFTRLASLFGLYLINAFINREIQAFLSFDENARKEEINKALGYSKDSFSAGISFYDKEIRDLAKKRIEELQKEIERIAEERKKAGRPDPVKMPPYSFFYGLLEFPALVKKDDQN